MLVGHGCRGNRIYGLPYISACFAGWQQASFLASAPMSGITGWRRKAMLENRHGRVKKAWLAWQLSAVCQMVQARCYGSMGETPATTFHKRTFRMAVICVTPPPGSNRLRSILRSCRCCIPWPGWRVIWPCRLPRSVLHAASSHRPPLPPTEFPGGR